MKRNLNSHITPLPSLAKANKHRTEVTLKIHKLHHFQQKDNKMFFMGWERVGAKSDVRYLVSLIKNLQ